MKNCCAKKWRDLRKKSRKKNKAGVAQLAAAADLGSAQCEFESRRRYSRNGTVDQLVSDLSAHNRACAGSNPACPTVKVPMGLILQNDGRI